MTNEPPPYPGEPHPDPDNPQAPPPASPPPDYGSVPPPPGSYPPPPPGSYPPPAGGSYPPPPPGGYYPAPGGYGPPAPKQNQMAIWSMITGIVSIVGLCCTFGGLIGIVSIILGLISRNEISKSHGTQTGTGMSIAGIVTGAIGILGFIVIILLIVTGVIDTSDYSTDFN